MSSTGLGLLGSTSIPKQAYTSPAATFDLLTPREVATAGVGLGSGFAVAVGVQLQYRWHVWDDHNVGSQLLFGPQVDVGFFDPHTSEADNGACALLCRGR